MNDDSELLKLADKVAACAIHVELFGQKHNDQIVAALRIAAQQDGGRESAAVAFVKWALQEGSWQGADLDGGSVQDKAESLGLIVKTQYDPEKHGPHDYAEPGYDWYVFSDLLRGDEQGVET